MIVLVLLALGTLISAVASSLSLMIAGRHLPARVLDHPR